MTKEEQNYLKSIELLGEQIKQSYQEAVKMRLSKGYRQVDQAVTCGMGGSQLPVDFVKSLFAGDLKMPIEQVKDYSLPALVNNKTLVILLSYSGTTEEVLNCFKGARKKKAKILIITSGGQLAKLADKHNLPAYIFEPINNPSGQPRMGTGYLIGSLLAILKKIGKLDLTEAKVREFYQAAEKGFKDYSCQASLKTLAKQLKNKIPVVVTAEHLQGNAHIMANQIQESAKQTTLYFSLPELNHHLMEGLTYPASNQKNLFFLFFNSVSYHKRNQKRFRITEQVIAKQKIAFKHFELKGSMVEQSARLLALGSLLSFYLAGVNQVDPNQIAWVNFFKSEMKK